MLEAAVVVDGGGRNEAQTRRLVDDVEVGPTESGQRNGCRQLDLQQVNPRILRLVPDLKRNGNLSGRSWGGGDGNSIINSVSPKITQQ